MNYPQTKVYSKDYELQINENRSKFMVFIKRDKWWCKNVGICSWLCL